VRDLEPSYFALVMATGIVSRAMRLDGAVALSDVLLAIALAVFVVMSGVYALRLVRYRREFAADARDPRRAFGFFTFGAAAGVLAAPLAASGDTAPAAVLLVLAVSGWLLLSYVVPMLVGGEEAVRPPLAGANGTWFVWAVGAQAVAVAATAFPPPVPAALAALGICCWMIGVVLYLVVAVLVATARLEFPLRPGDPTAPYWVFMGATAISVLAGSQILRLDVESGKWENLGSFNANGKRLGIYGIRADSQNNLLLGHVTPEPAQVSLNSPEIPKLFSQLHIAICYLYIAICKLCQVHSCVDGCG